MLRIVMSFYEFVLNTMRGLAERGINLESSEKTIQRLEMFKRYVNVYFEESKYEIMEEEKILVVGHSILFKHLTSKFLNDLFEPNENDVVMKNCEVVGMSWI